MQKAKDLLLKLQTTLTHNLTHTSRKPSIPVVEVRGFINANCVERINRSTKRLPSSLEALAVLVNSREGTAAHAWIILQRLQVIARERKIPLYMFAQEVCMGPALMVLTGGDRVYVDRTTVVGGTTVGAHKYTIETDLAELNLYKQPNNNFLSQDLQVFRPISEQKRQQVLQLSQQSSDLMASYVKTFRKDRLKSQDYRNTLLIGEQAVEAGLADGIGTYNSVLSEEHPGAEVKNMVESHLWKQIKRVRSWGGQPRYI